MPDNGYLYTLQKIRPGFYTERSVQYSMMTLTWADVDALVFFSPQRRVMKVVTMHGNFPGNLRKSCRLLNQSLNSIFGNFVLEH